MMLKKIANIVNQIFKKKKKIRIGIDIDEVLRAKWLQFDKIYYMEFGEDGIPPNQPYVYDYFNKYGWHDTIETIKDLKEPDEMPENINPLDYQIDEKTGEALADYLLFKKPKKVTLSAKEVYNRFMYEDFLFEIHGAAPLMYKGMDLDVNNFNLKYSDYCDIVILSVENWFSIPPTLFFLSKIMSRFKNYKFVDDSLEMWKHVDVLITTDPKILTNNKPRGKKLIKINRPYNEHMNKGLLTKLQIADLIGDLQFEKIIKYKNTAK